MIKKVEEFVKKVDELKKEMLGEDSGFCLLAYQKIDEKQQHNTFAGSGSFSNMAECFVALMKKDPTMSNIILAASSAITHQRLTEAQILAEAKNGNKNTKKRKKGNNGNNQD